MIIIFDLRHPVRGDEPCQIAVVMGGVPPVGTTVTGRGLPEGYEIARYETVVTGTPRDYSGSLIAVLQDADSGPMTLEA